MVYRRRVVIAIVVAFATRAGVYADMMPVFPVDAVPCPAAPVGDRTVSQSSNSPSPLISPASVDLHLRSVVFLPTTNAEVQPASEAQPPLQLRGPDRGSFDFCLYAFMGLGLCRSAPWMKQLSSLACLPDGYHCAGPYQIGHSLPVGPDSLSSATVVCFVQPICTMEDSLPQYCLGTIASLWRKSQFTPTVLASRGSPL